MESFVNKKAKNIVKKLIEDLTDRCGFDHQWDETDEEIQKEIKKIWIGIIKEELLKGD